MSPLRGRIEDSNFPRGRKDFLLRMWMEGGGMSVRIDELLEECQTLVEMLENPQPGLSTYQDMVQGQMRKVEKLISNAWKEKLVE